jgi:hypothetical protein
MNKLRWFSGIKRRILKKLLSGGICHDGIVYNFIAWEELVQKALSLKPGDKVYNPYRHIFTTVTEIKFSYGNIGKSGRFINEVIIYDDKGYLIYDPLENR